MRKIIAILIASVIPIFHAGAVELGFDLCQFNIIPYTIFFSNGVGNTPKQAYVSLVELQKQMLEQQREGTDAPINATEIKILYHANNGLIQDISETLLQKARAEARNQDVTWTNIIDLVNGATTTATLGLSQLVVAVTSFNSDQLKAKSLAQVDAESAADLILVTKYLNDNAGSRILMVGHSQGTLYANGVFESAIKQQSAGKWTGPASVENSIRVVNVGAAADRVAGQSDPSNPPQYVTSTGDTVIQLLRGLSSAVDLNPPLAANNNAQFTRSVPGEGGLFGDIVDAILGHGFVSTYLYDTSSTYPLQTLLRNAMLERVRLQESKNNGVTFDVEIDVTAPLGANVYPDSTSFDGPPPVIRSRALEFSDVRVFVSQGPGTTTYRKKASLYCNLDPVLNLRPDSLLRATQYDFNNKILAGYIYKTVRSTVTAARIRVVPTDGSAPADWTQIDTSKAIDVDATTTKLPLFAYSESMRVGSLHLTVTP